MRWLWMKYGLGVDVGGTKIATVIINKQGNILDRVVVPSNPDSGEKMFQQLIISIERVLEKARKDISMIEGVGIGIPGKVDRENGIAVFQNNLPWRNFPLVERFKDYFPIENIILDNDVYMAAMAEWNVSNISYKSTFVYVTVSTGISCSIIQEGSFFRGRGFAGELGLLTVKAKSSPNGLSRLEKSAAGPAIQKLFADNFNSPNMTTEDFFVEYLKGSAIADEVMDEVTESLAQGVYSIISLLDPHKIVFGGGVVNNHPYLLDLVLVKLKKYIIKEQQHVLDKIQVSNLKDDSGAVGAALRGIQLVNGGDRKLYR